MKIKIPSSLSMYPLSANYLTHNQYGTWSYVDKTEAKKLVKILREEIEKINQQLRRK